jgi:asparagine N-glycosylation enzyme membrane subunit Stt3
MSLFLLLLLLAVALGITGVAVSGLSYLLVLGVIVLVADLLLLGVRLGRGRGKRVTR